MLRSAGSGRRQRRAQAAEISGREPEELPVAPKELEGDARKEWDRTVERLSVSKIVSVVDAAALYQHCQLFAETEAIAGQ